MERWKWAYPRLWVSLAVVSLFWPWAVASFAHQIRIGPASPDANGENDDAGSSNFSPPDRNVLQLLVRSKKALGEHRYGEALEGLAEILRGNQDFLQPDHKGPIYRGLKAEALELLGGMPREGRDLYEVRQRGRSPRSAQQGGCLRGRKHAVGGIRPVLPHAGRLRSHLPSRLAPHGPRRPAGRRADAQAAPRRRAGRGGVRARLVAGPGRLLLPGGHGQRLSTGAIRFEAPHGEAVAAARWPRSALVRR